MLRYLLQILAPGEKLPPGVTQFSVSAEGVSWGWAFFALVTIVAALTWSYCVYAPGLSRLVRIGFVSLRSILLGLLLILLVCPVLLITVEEPVRRPLLVLLDNSQSMGLVDQRSTPEDLARAALAKGLVSPSSGLKQPVDSKAADLIRQLSRGQLIEAEAANTELNLWPRLHTNVDIDVYGFGRKLTELGALAPPPYGKLTPDECAVFFHSIQYKESSTALGDGLRDLLDLQRGQQPAGILVITDGANNSGSSPVEAAAIAKEDGVPLFIYGIGVTAPQDIAVNELSGPQVSSVKEKVEMRVTIRAQCMAGRKAVVQLKANGKVVDEQPLEFRMDGDQEVLVSYTPDTVGEVNLEAYVPPLAEEAIKENNVATTHLRVVDDKIKVLLVESAPHWDYRYLSAMLQRDRRIKLKIVLLQNHDDSGVSPDSVYLQKLPEDKETLLANDLIVIGDVDPAEIGDTRMKLLRDWVSNLSGNLIFMAGPKFSPNAYQGTPLEALLPVETLGKFSDRYDEPVKLELTAAGETSPMLALSENPGENAAIWGGFPPVNWTAWVNKARPGAQILLSDPTSGRANRDGPMPVIAKQTYGAGQTLFVGTDETYRWRSRLGEKYYTRIWSQVIQGLCGQHANSSSLTQLKTDRVTYLTGDRVRISGRIFKPGFEPLTDGDVPGTVTVKISPDASQSTPAPQVSQLNLQAVPDQPGEYQGEITAVSAGSYSYSIARDPSAVLKFEVTDPKLEFSDIAMNEKLLRDMATASGGQFLREEDLFHLPDLITSKSEGSVSLKKIPLTFSPYFMGLLIFVACLEWFWRRKLELK